MTVPDATLRQLEADAPGMIGIGAAVLVLFALCEVLRRFGRMDAEHTRKIAHVGGGAVVMGLPWAIAGAPAAVVLCLAFLGVLGVGRWTGALGSVHGVARRSAGAYLYPFAVAATFLLSRGDPLLFCAPVAVMAIADTGAALVGRRLGRTAYRVMDGARTVEGSAVFFGLALGILGLALVADGRVSLPGALGASLIAAGLTTAVEAISVRGVDNLFVPWAAWLVLDRAVHGAPMAGWLEGMGVAGVGIAVASRRLALRPAGAASLFVFATLAGGIGGAGWLVPMVALVPLLAWFERGDPADLEAVFPGIVASLLVVVAAAHSDPGPWRVPFLVTLGASGTIAMLRARRGWLGVGIAALLPASAAWAWDGGAPAPLVAGGIGGLLLWLVVRHGPLPGRRLVASLVPGLVARILVGALG